jgi:ATP-dependent Clp endopeptidase proteolytic subunit ClpP
MQKYKFLNVVVTSGGRASLMIYGDIGSDEGVNAEMVNAELLALQQEFPDIDVHINSRGGEVFAGIAIYNALRSSTSRINIYVDGLAASIAGVIALCGKPLYMSRYSRLMLHQVTGGCEGSARDMRKCADLIEGLEDSLAEMISSKCGMPADDVRAEFFDGSDHWMTADEAQRRRLCDGIFDLANAGSLGAAPTAEAVYAFANSLRKPSNTDKMDLYNELKKESSFKDLGEEQALSQIKTLANEAAKVPALEAKITDLEAKLGAAKEGAITAYLNQAVSEGRISQEQVDTYKKLMAADEASTRALIDALPKKAASIKDYLGTGAPAGNGKNDLANMSWDEIDKAERLAELKNEHPDLYAKKFKEKFGA